VCSESERSAGWAFCSSFIQVAINFFQFGRNNKSMDSSSTKDMDSPVISGDTFAAEDSTGFAENTVLRVVCSSFR